MAEKRQKIEPVAEDLDIDELMARAKANAELALTSAEKAGKLARKTSESQEAIDGSASVIEVEAPALPNPESVPVIQATAIRSEVVSETGDSKGGGATRDPEAMTTRRRERGGSRVNGAAQRKRRKKEEGGSAATSVTAGEPNKTDASRRSSETANPVLTAADKAALDAIVSAGADAAKGNQSEVTGPVAEHARKVVAQVLGENETEGTNSALEKAARANKAALDAHAAQSAADISTATGVSFSPSKKGSNEGVVYDSGIISDQVGATYGSTVTLPSQIDGKEIEITKGTIPVDSTILGPVREASFGPKIQTPPMPKPPEKQTVEGGGDLRQRRLNNIREALKKYEKDDENNPLSVARKLYAKRDFEKESIFRRIANVLGGGIGRLKNKTPDFDDAKKGYELQLKSYIGLKLDELQARRDLEGLTQDQFARESSELLKELAIEGHLRLDAANVHAKAESYAKNSWQRLVELPVSLAQWLRQHPKTRLAIGIGMVGFGTVFSGTAGAMVALAAWRVIQGTGTALVAEGFLKKLSERDSRIQKILTERAVGMAGATNQSMEALKQNVGTLEELAAAKEEMLNMLSGQVAEAYKKQKQVRRNRRIISGGIGLAVGGAALYLDYFRATGGVEADGVDGALGVDQFRVEKGDTVWKFLGQHAAIQNEDFANLPPEVRQKVVGKLWLKALELQKSGSIGVANIDKIEPGDVINLSGISEDDIRKAITDVTQGNTGASAATQAAVDAAGAQTPGNLGRGFLATNEALLPPDTAPTATTATGAPIQEAARVAAETSKVPLDMITEVNTSPYRARIDDWMMQIFRKPGDLDDGAYIFQREKFLNLSLFDLDKDFASSATRTGLTTEQVRDAELFLNGVRKIIGASELRRIVEESIGLDGKPSFGRVIARIAESSSIKPGQVIDGAAQSLGSNPRFTTTR